MIFLIAKSYIVYQQINFPPKIYKKLTPNFQFYTWLCGKSCTYRCGVEGLEKAGRGCKYLKLIWGFPIVVGVEFLRFGYFETANAALRDSHRSMQVLLIW